VRGRVEGRDWFKVQSARFKVKSQDRHELLISYRWADAGQVGLLQDGSWRRWYPPAGSTPRPLELARLNCGQGRLNLSFFKWFTC